jgi:hypothetical protein
MIMALGAAAHLAVIGVGAKGYAVLGAPAGLVAMVETSSYRPAITCIFIASLLMMGAIYGLSGAGLVTRLPYRRLILTLLGVGLVARAVLLPVAVVWQPQTLVGICGRCQLVNGFVLLTSALCLFVGLAYAVGANMSIGPEC